MAQIKSYVPFTKTRWTVIQALGGDDETAREQAREMLAAQYLSPVYSYIRSKGHSRIEATEAVQSFFAEVVFQRDLFERAEEGRGRLRSLLKKAVDRHLIDLLRKDQRRRQHEVPAAALEAEEGSFLELQGEAPDDVFEKRWAAAVIREATFRCWEQLVEAGQEECFELFVRWFGAKRASQAVARPNAEALAAEFGLASADQVYSMTRRVRLRLQEAIREVLREEVGSEQEVDEELRHLGRIINIPLLWGASPTS